MLGSVKENSKKVKQHGYINHVGQETRTKFKNEDFYFKQFFKKIS